MAIIKSKGTIFAKSVGNAYTTISQIISLDLPEVAAETFEADYLDNNSAGIPYAPTGRTEGGSVSGEVFLDMNLASHKLLTALLTTPAASAWKITDAANSAMTFSAAGVSLGGSVALKEGIKGKFSVKLDGIPTFPT